ncbi:MAG TPA: acetoacetate--CoA ligase [candidate division Zixibacteria bacterium]|nr:acetoacetate--CoA ligase [candidate division Zixibacteria bacterium]
MGQVYDGKMLWHPSESVIRDANLTAYMNWLETTLNLSFESFAELWQWSVDDLGAFWRSIWDYFSIVASRQFESIITDHSMPGASWFEGSRLNYAENFFARKRIDQPAIIFTDESGSQVEVSWSELEVKTRALAAAMRAFGVGRGDRVVAFMPHIPETIIALFATASIGAIWSSCSPDFGSRSVLDRFQQIEPKLLIAVDGYQYGGKVFDRRSILAEMQSGLPSIEKTIIISQIPGEEETKSADSSIFWHELIDQYGDADELAFEQVPFDHPLWVLYSSGTTGLPKPIVQGHGGILLEHFKMAALHLDLKPADRFFWYTSTGWMMWNFQISGLLLGCTLVVYNGSPGFPDMNALWKLADSTGITYFGTAAAFISACMKAGISPSETFDLSRIRAVGSTGSPLTAEGFQWIYDNINQDLAVESVSGGTDLCTAFVGGCRLLPVYAGEIQVAALGAKVESFDQNGNPIVGEVGELVITKPMPSMPLYLWNDPGNARYLDSYFDVYPEIWRHGDWIKFTERGSCIIYGRSDSTINRQGIRMGTSEIYRVVESLPEIIDALVIDLELRGRESYMPLFLVLADGISLDDGLRAKILKKIRMDVSPRHVPNDLYQIKEVPYTLSGKKMEVPVRRILLGQPIEKVVNPGAMRNPESINYFVDLAELLANH